MKKSKDSLYEKTYIDINSQKQFISIKSENTENPVVLNLHGGPSYPDTHLIYKFSQEMAKSFTFVNWEQRGCGRTYYKNKSTHPLCADVNFEQAVLDLDELVNYLLKRFRKEKIIILGHSYGTFLGTAYVKLHPEKVLSYIGLGQVVSIKKTQKENYDYVIKNYNLKLKTERINAIRQANENFLRNPNIKNYFLINRLLIPIIDAEELFLKNKKAPSQLSSLFSPDISLESIKWMALSMNFEKFISLTSNLFDYILNNDIESFGENFSVPMYYISGSFDMRCSLNLLREYFKKIKAPKKDFVILRQCGHSPQIDEPQKTAELIKRFLK